MEATKRLRLDYTKEDNFLMHSQCLKIRQITFCDFHTEDKMYILHILIFLRVLIMRQIYMVATLIRMYSVHTASVPEPVPVQIHSCTVYVCTAVILPSSLR
jgi:hypothetical protein